MDDISPWVCFYEQALKVNIDKAQKEKSTGHQTHPLTRVET